MPKVQIIGILLLYFAVVASLIGLPTALFLLVICVGSTVFLDSIFTYIRRIQHFKPFAAIVTGLILTLIIDPSATWYQILVICTAAIGIKNFARFGDRHVLNPAASGLFVGWIVFGLQPSWWGATVYRGGDSMILNMSIYVLLLAIAYVSCYKIGRYNSVFSYVLLYAALFLFITSSFSIQGFARTIVNPGILFYALLMLPEPMTSPVNKKWQLMYGSIVAVINVLLVYVVFTSKVENFPDSSIIALLFGNILFFKKG